MADDPRLTDLLVRWQKHRQQGQSVSVEELCPDNPELTGRLRHLITAQQTSSSGQDTQPHPETGPQPPAEPMDLSFLAPPQGPDELGRLGGFAIRRVLGYGGMGIVLEA